MTSVVTATGLTRDFGAHRGIRDVSFEVRQGEVFGFLGPNGAGKSTTIRIMLGLYRRDAGEVTVLAHDPARENVQINARTGYLPGELALHARLTGQQHVDFVARARGLTDTSMRDELVRRFDVELDRPVKNLSKGNRQKIGIVLTFMHRPDFLVLDEPTSGLDPLLQDEFARLVRETVDEGRTVFLSSHELDEVQRVVDRLAIIKDGRIIVTDTVEGLRSQAPRTVEFRFDTSVDSAVFEHIDGVHVTSNDNGTVTLSVSGPIAPVLRAAADRDVVDVTARPTDLEELFLRYYRTGKATEAADR
jgi:ABC-2 type transport system ATP-binding protein